MCTVAQYHALASKETRNDREEGNDESRDVEVEDGVIVRPDDARPDVGGLRARCPDRAVDGLDLRGGKEAAELLRQVLGHLVAPDCGSDSAADGTGEVRHHAQERDGRGHVLCRSVSEADGEAVNAWSWGRTA